MTILDLVDFDKIKITHHDGLMHMIEIDILISEDLTTDEAQTINDILIKLGKLKEYHRSFILLKDPGVFLICIS